MYANNIWKYLPIDLVTVFFLTKVCTNPLNTGKAVLALFFF